MTAIKTFPYSPAPGWSTTRYDHFSMCKRNYYYQYYAKHDTEFKGPVIDRFKNLTSVPMETGTIVHQVIAVFLNRLKKTATAIDRTRFFDFARHQTLDQLNAGTFEETVYGSTDRIDPDRVFQTVAHCLTQLLDQERYTWLVDNADGTADKWIIDPPGYGESRLKDLKVYCKVDFLFPVGDELYIIDWKTGKPDSEKHRKQLIGYATWAAYHFDVDASHVRTAVAYLQPNYQEVTEVFNAFDIEQFAIQVRAETEELYGYCRDTAQNIPKDKSQFARIDDERVCPYCKFRGLCFPDQYPTDLPA